MASRLEPFRNEGRQRLKPGGQEVDLLLRLHGTIVLAPLRALVLDDLEVEERVDRPFARSKEAPVACGLPARLDRVVPVDVGGGARRAANRQRTASPR